MQALRRTTRWLLIGATLIYCIGLLTLAALWASAGPRPWWLAIANVFALLLFAPLLLCIPAALVIRSWWMRGAVAAALVLFLALFGARFLPRSAPPSSGTAIRVMTFNQLFTNERVADIIREIRAQDADVVGLTGILRADCGGASNRTDRRVSIPVSGARQPERPWADQPLSISDPRHRTRVGTASA